jgi:hypothetical protein
MKMERAGSRKRERGQVAALFAVLIAVTLVLMVTVSDIAIVDRAYHHLVGIADRTARAGVEAAVDLGGYGLGNGTKKINPQLATSAAQAFFADLALGSQYQLTVLSATTAGLSVQVQTVVSVLLYGAVTISARSSPTPAVDV